MLLLVQPPPRAGEQGCEQKAWAGSEGGVDAGLPTIRRTVASLCGAGIQVTSGDLGMV